MARDHRNIPAATFCNAMQLTITEAARLFGKHRATVHRHIDAGRLSCTVRGDGKRVIDLSEAIRAYGEPREMPGEMQQSATATAESMQQAMLQALQAMHAELVALRQEVAALKDQPRLLPAPAPARDGVNEAAGEPRRDSEGESPGDDDPHGLRALARELLG
ncbi:helix-turn-helix domain-containing protein [Afifella aestuarii]|uniref:helix-turn-helix domain-containing protein n=1 Tax=Afifella aestuarii TaxID=1909496 RepID=UPI000FE3687C|nr:helix-turn-helix domain-containing protein [Afifella aestuarii]